MNFEVYMELLLIVYNLQPTFDENLSPGGIILIKHYILSKFLDETA